MVEGLILFLDYLFTTFPYRKVFADIPEYNLGLIAGLPESVLSQEGRQVDYFWYAGELWDRCFYSISREVWEPIVQALAFLDPAGDGS